MGVIHPTKRQILDHLKRRGAATLDDLVHWMCLARATLRQHLISLQRDGLVEVRQEKGPAGRPRHVYRLAPAGHETYPKRYEWLVLLLLEVVGELSPAELQGLDARQKQALVLSRALDRLASGYFWALEGKGLGARVKLVSQILREQGSMVEWRRVGSRYEMVDYNCLFPKVAESYRAVCEWHTNLLARLLGHPVRCVERISEGSNACRFVVDP